METYKVFQNKPLVSPAHVIELLGDKTVSQWWIFTTNLFNFQLCLLFYPLNIPGYLLKQDISKVHPYLLKELTYWLESLTQTYIYTMYHTTRTRTIAVVDIMDIINMSCHLALILMIRGSIMICYFASFRRAFFNVSGTCFTIKVCMTMLMRKLLDATWSL